MALIKRIEKKNIERIAVIFLKHLLLFFTFFITIGILTNCSDKDLFEPTDSTVNVEESIPGFSIGFTVKLDKDDFTRSTYPISDVDKYDNYIDTRNKFRVFFFDKDGRFMFGAIDRTVTSSQNIGSDTWYVRVPINYIVDRNGNPYDVEELKNYLKTHPFKVAVLANWPNEGKVPSEYEGSEDDENNESSPGDGIDWNYINREPNWGWNESVLNEEAVKAGTVKSINDLHHLVVDKNYNNEDGKFGPGSDNKNRPARIEAYDFIMGDTDADITSRQGKMGVQCDWVKMRDIDGEDGWKITHYQRDISNEPFDTKEKAEEWIKANWTPEIYYNDRKVIYRHYKYIWKLWDFDASCRSNPSINYYPYDNKWGRQWYERNGSDLKTWINNVYSTLNPTLRQQTFDFSTSRYTHITAEANFSFKGTTARRNTTTKAGMTGIEPGEDGEFHFTAHSSGTLRIKFCNTGSGSAKLYVSSGSNADKISPKTLTVTGTTPTVVSQDFNITGKIQEFSITVSGGTPVIYSIEYIRSKYLYDTDREGIPASEENPIPMYGVQNFEPLTDWEEGTTYNLSASDPTDPNSEPKYISLIRSVAKVIVYLPEKASQIYLRSANRTGRCEPMDVETPTDLLWKSNHINGQCEWFTIQKYGSGFSQTGGDPSNKSELAAYTNWLSWIYASWTKAKWFKQSNGSFTGWDFKSHNLYNGSGGITKDNVTIPDTTILKPPRLFNPDINRSDYAHFNYYGFDGHNHVYVLYVPEKNISDPNNVGNPSSISKIARIEYRFSSGNVIEDTNDNSLDDNQCYRIYFTNYGGAENQFGPLNSSITSVEADDYEVTYEKKTENLDMHWPIMRNHVYEFYVEGRGTATPRVQARVKDWGYEKVVVEW